MSRRRPEIVPRRGRLAAVLGSVLLVAPGCGHLRHPFSSGAKSRTGSIMVAPPTGPVGTAFSFTAGGFKPGEPMTFEVDIPNHPRFVGPSHVAGPDGRVTSTYTPLTGDPPGTYQVKAVGSLGTRAQTRLAVLPAPPPAG